MLYTYIFIWHACVFVRWYPLKKLNVMILFSRSMIRHVLYSTYTKHYKRSVYKLAS